MKLSDVDIKEIITEYIKKNHIRELSHSDIIEILLRHEMKAEKSINGYSTVNVIGGKLIYRDNDIEHEIDDIVPRMPDNVSRLIGCKEYILYCRKIAEDFLETTSLYENEKSSIDKTELAIETTIKSLSSNSRKAFDSFSLRQRLKEKIKEDQVRIEDINQVVISLLIETEVHIIRVLNDEYEDVKNLDELAEILKLPLIDKKYANELYEYWWYERDGGTIGEIITRFNNGEGDDLSTIKKNAHKKLYDAFMNLGDDVYVKIYALFTDSIQKCVLGDIYRDNECYGWRSGIIISVAIEFYLSLLLIGYKNINDYTKQCSQATIFFLSKLDSMFEEQEGWSKEYKDRTKLMVAIAREIL